MAADPLAQPRPELVALLDAVKDDPDEDTPRLVLADWLDEQGSPLDAERAELIRAHIAALAALERGEAPDWYMAEEQAGRFRRWLGPAAALAYNHGFDRGLPYLMVSAPRLLERDARMLLTTEAFAFVQFLLLDRATGPRLEKLVARPEFRHVTGLLVTPERELGAQSSARVFGSPNLAGMRRLACRDFQPGLAGMRALASNPGLARLRKLQLTSNSLAGEAVAALAGSPHLAHLMILDLNENLVGDADARVLADSPHLAGLRELELRFNPRLTGRGKRLLRDRFGGRVRLD